MDELNGILDRCRNKSLQKELDKKLLQPLVHMQEIPSKSLCSKLILAFNYWLKIPQEKLKIIVEIMRIIHCSSLLIDDIEDNSTNRRGVPVAHSIYGVGSTINTVCFSMFLTQEKVLQLNHENALNVYTEQILELHRGQGMEIYWRDNFICPTEAEYKQMTVHKTGAMFMLAIRLMQLFSDNKKDFSRFAAILGIYSQIRNDYVDLKCKEADTENENFFDDLTEGTFSFPIIHAVLAEKEDRQVLQILRQRTRDIRMKKYCINLLEKLGSFKYTRDVLERIDNETRTEVAALGSNPIMENILNELRSTDEIDA